MAERIAFRLEDAGLQSVVVCERLGECALLGGQSALQSGHLLAQLVSLPLFHAQVISQLGQLQAGRVGAAVLGQGASGPQRVAFGSALQGSHILKTTIVVFSRAHEGEDSTMDLRRAELRFSLGTIRGVPPLGVVDAVGAPLEDRLPNQGGGLGSAKPDMGCLSAERDRGPDLLGVERPDSEALRGLACGCPGRSFSFLSLGACRAAFVF